MPTIEDFQEIYYGVLIGIILMLIGFVLMSVPLSSASEDGCMFCHSGIDEFMLDSQTTCGDCHNVNDASHAANGCPSCHGITNKDTYHKLHTNTSCENCHINLKVPQGITFNSCSSCHTKPVGEIHSFTSNTMQPLVTVIKPNKSWEKYTIYSVLKVILEQYKVIQ